MAEVTPDEVWRLFKDTAIRFKDLEERFKDTENRFKDTENRFRDLEAGFRESRALADRVSRNVDALTGKWGRFVEGLVIPAAKTLFARRGIPVHRVSQRMRGEVGDLAMEVDVVVENDNQVVLVEVKSTLAPADVDEHLERLPKFKTVFPRYADARILGAVAAIEFVGQSDRYAYRKGLFVIGQSGDSVEILNDDRFQPREW